MKQVFILIWLVVDGANEYTQMLCASNSYRAVGPIDLPTLLSAQVSLRGNAAMAADLVLAIIGTIDTCIK
jgi:hypothetical protein